MTETFNPDRWMTSLFRSLKDYLEAGLDNVYDLEMSYPDPEDMKKRMPLAKTLLTFECDNPRQIPFGLGDNVVQSFEHEPAGTVEEWEAHCHEVDIDVGIWASIESGGTTARWEAREDLDLLLNGPAALEACMEATGGIEIQSFSGGRFITDSINDVVVLRVVDMTLKVRVFSRTKKVPISYVDSVEQSPGLVIDDTVIIG